MTERDISGAPRRTTDSSRRRGPNRRQFVKATAGITTGLSVAGCLDSYGDVVGAAEGEDPVTIGMLAPSPESDLIGRSMVRSARLAVDELNENGGIDGRPVELAVGNTKSSPLEGRRQYQRLVLEEGADVTVGVFASEVLMNLIGDIAEQELLHLTTGAATTDVSRLVHEEYDRYKYHFRVGPVNDVGLGRMQVDFLTEMSDEIGWDSIALLAEDYSWTERPWEVYQESIGTTGVDVVTEERYSPAIDDFSTLYDDAEEQGADAVFITTAHTGTEALLNWSVPQRQFAFGGIHVPMQLPAYYDMVDGACRYGVGQTSATANSTITEKTQDFVGAYQDKYDGTNPVYTGYHTYDAITLFAHIVEQERTLESETLIPALEDVSFTGSAETVEFHEPDHEFAHDLIYDKEETIYFQWQEDGDGNGVQEVIWPEKQATGSYVRPPWLE